MGELHSVASAITAVAAEAAEEGGKQNNFLIPNGTFFVVLAIFLIVLAVIGTFVVPPIQKVLKAREDTVAKTAEDNRNAAEQFTAAEADYKDELAKARGAATAVRDEARAEGRGILEDMRQRANTEATAVNAKAAEELARQGEATSGELSASVESLSRTLAERVLGVSLSEPANAGRG
ncbi:F0F1 ATP synthase subunit B [Mycobacteroides saopaulense]|uniref:ATP synthase subunit b n=1 Tax=Mycobacteroides saopaulense TaxID=1578165 RepID=A0A1S4VZJ7_9MYCO|nr:F0F1 ATP synthase subunit B [Mycobacteroides saopaulense]ALR11156.1 ATP synthase F0F1 subunit B [Mycobacteroides saopaulense]ORB59591.1 F0F1 ATP synthase subunit B [Mycobacteroides saopaulense]